jgi:glutathione S-transferase
MAGGEKRMAITFYYGAGSPFAWRVWLALEHKALAYELKVLSFSEGDLKKPEFAALNPRRKVPVLVDAQGQGNAPFVLYESAAIIEYLEESYPGSGAPLFPTDLRGRALVRRMVCEADNYVAPAVNRLLSRVLFTPEAQWNENKIADACSDCIEELGTWAPQFRGEFLAGPLSAADLTLYPMVALALRCENRKPDLAVGAALPQPMRDWMRRIEGLPYFAKTWPAHWK